MNKNDVNLLIQVASDYAGVKESIFVCLSFQVQLDGGQTH